MTDDLARLLRPRRDLADGCRRWGWQEALVALGVLFGTGVGVFRFTKKVVGSGNNWDITWPFYELPYLGLCVVVVGLVWVFAMSDTRLRLPSWVAALLAWACVAMLVRFYVLHEPAYAPGSDNADALEVGARALKARQFPYHEVTKLGGPLSPMVGGFLLAMPIIFVGVTLYSQMIVWLAIGFRCLQRFAGSSAALAAAALTWCSVMMREAIPRQSDNWIVPLAVVLLGTWGWWLASRDAAGPGSRDARAGWGTRALPWVVRAAWTVLFACALAYRFTLWAAVLPLGVFWWRTLGWRSLRSWAAPVAAVTALLVLGPFAVDAQAYLAGPFAMGGSKTGSIGAGAVVGAVTLSVLVATSWRVRTLAGAWGALALTMAAMVLTVGLTRVPAEGVAGAFSAYVTIAFNGAIFVPALAWLTLPRLGGTVRD